MYIESIGSSVSFYSRESKGTQQELLMLRGAMLLRATRLGAGLRVSPQAVRRAGTVAVPDQSGRTPERTAELERLAEEHNGFLFGELVC